MDLTTAIEILKEYRDWRQGDSDQMLSPRVISKALNTVIKHHEKKTEQRPRNVSDTSGLESAGSRASEAV
jgi:hypothetical protein